MAAAQDAENAVRALTRANAGPVSLAVVGTLAGGQLSPILKRFAREYPDVELTLRTATSAEVSDLIRRGEAAIGLRYDIDRLRDLDADSCCRAVAGGLRAPIIRWPASACKARRSQGERWIAFPVCRAPRNHGVARFALFQTHGLGEIAWTPVDSLTAQKRLVEAGLGIALLTKAMPRMSCDFGTISTIRVGDLTASQES